MEPMDLEPILSQEVFNKLIEVSPKTFNEEISILKELGLIEFINFKSLIELIIQGYEHSQQLINILGRDYVKEKEANKNVTFHFPITKDRHLVPLIMQLFFYDYLKQDKDYFKEINCQKDDSPDGFSKIHQKKVQPHFYFVNPQAHTSKDYQKDRQKVEKQMQRPEPPETKFEAYCRERRQNNQKIEFLQKIGDDRIDQESIIPEFFYTINKRTRISARRLVMFDVNHIFSKEKDEVVKVLDNQIYYNSYIFQKFYSYALNFHEFYCLREGMCQTEDQLMDFIMKFYMNNYLYNQIQIFYVSEKHKSPVLTYWEQVMLPKLKNERQKSPKKEKVMQILKKGLKSVHTYYTPFAKNDVIYAKNLSRRNEKTIFVCINPVTSAEMPYQQARKDLLKPYLFLCIIHELAHYLTRCLEGYSVSKSNSSLNLNRNTKGCKILQITKRLGRTIASIFKKLGICYTLHQSKKYKRDIVEQARQTILNILDSKQYKNITSTYCQNFQEIQNFKKFFRSVSYVTNVLHISTNEFPQSEVQQLVKQTFEYFQKQQVQDDKKKLQNRQLKQQQYKFLYLLFKTSRIFMFFSSQNTDDLHLLKINANRKHYFIGSQTKIDQFLQRFTKIDRNFFNSTLFKQFCIKFEKCQNIQEELKDQKLKLDMLYAKFSSSQLTQVKCQIEQVQNLCDQNRLLKIKPFSVFFTRLLFSQQVLIMTFEDIDRHLKQFLKLSEIAIIATQIPHFFLEGRLEN